MDGYSLGSGRATQSGSSVVTLALANAMAMASSAASVVGMLVKAEPILLPM